jgi:hypothetical protein
MPIYIDAYGFILLGGSVVLFWLVLFLCKEKIALTDFPRLLPRLLWRGV